MNSLGLFLLAVKVNMKETAIFVGTCVTATAMLLHPYILEAFVVDPILDRINQTQTEQNNDKQH